METVVLVVLVVLVLVCLAGGLLGWRAVRRDRAALESWAAQHGWTYAAKDPTLTSQWREHPIRGIGMASAVLRGTVPEGEVLTFTRNRTANSGDSHVAVIDLRRRLPTVVAGPRPLRVPGPGPSVEVDLADPEFSWQVMTYPSEDAEEVRRLLTAPVRTRLLHEAATSPTGPAITLTTEGQHLLVHTVMVEDVAQHERSVALLRDLARATGDAQAD